jgi:medium-chain acyl-[acyl-carrier-protein] hydrolase
MLIENGIYNSDFSLYTHDVDASHHATLIYYLQIMQEVASSHSHYRNLGIQQLNTSGMTWVLARTRITVSKYALWTERFSVQTWPQALWKLFFPRGTKAFDSEGNELFKAISQWVVLDLSSRRPLKPTSLAESFGLPTEDVYYSPDLGKRIIYSDEDLILLSEHKPKILYTDTDINGHVNNIRYVQWMLASLPDLFQDTYEVSEFDVSYLAETLRTDSVCIRTGAVDASIMEQEKPVLVHEVLKTLGDGKQIPVCSAQSSWRKKNQ